MNKGIKLTIVIPTYNRAKLLKICLDSIINQIFDCVEILVCDNASKDETINIMDEYCKKYKFIRYIRQNKNMGPDYNILTGLKSAKGNYIQLLSDDDFLIEGALDKYKKYILDNKRYSLIHLNSISYKNINNIDLKNKVININKDCLCKDGNEYLNTVGIFATFLSALIINREEFLKVRNPEKFIGTYLLQTNISINCLNSELDSVVVAEPCIAALAENSGGYNFYRVFVEEWGKILFVEAGKLGYDIKLMKKIYIKTIKDFIAPFTIKMKLYKTKFDSRGIGLILRNTYKYKESWIFLYPVLLCPTVIFKILKKIIN